MTPKPDDERDDLADNGVLDGAVPVETSSISLMPMPLPTTTVSIAFPTRDEDDDLADDVVEGEVPRDELIVDEPEIVEEDPEDAGGDSDANDSADEPEHAIEDAEHDAELVPPVDEEDDDLEVVPPVDDADEVVPAVDEADEGKPDAVDSDTPAADTPVPDTAEADTAEADTTGAAEPALESGDAAEDPATLGAGDAVTADAAESESSPAPASAPTPVVPVDTSAVAAATIVPATRRAAATGPLRAQRRAASGAIPITTDRSPTDRASTERASTERAASDGTSTDRASAETAPRPAAAKPAEKSEAKPLTKTPEPARAVRESAGRDEPMTSRRVGDVSSASVRETPDLLTSDRLIEDRRLTRPEPEGAWAHLLYTLSGGRINIGDGKRARARKELDRRIASPLQGGARFVAVTSRKGGVGKTTVTTLLGMALASAREDRVVAVDANPDRGTLADRISRQSGKTVRDLVREADNLRGYNDISDIVARDETRLDVLASDTDPHVSEAFSAEEYQAVADVTAHYYSIVLTDTGTGIVHSVMGATLNLSDQLIVVTGPSVDESRLASETLTWLEMNGYEDRVRDAIVVVNSASPGAPMVRLDEIERHFGSRVREVIRIPYDSLIAAGGAIVFRDLQPATREAARTLAARVVEGLQEHRSA